MVELSYEDFLKLAWKDRGKPRDAPLYRDIYFNLVTANIIKLKGAMPDTNVPSVEVRLERLEKEVFKGEEC